MYLFKVSQYEDSTPSADTLCRTWHATQSASSSIQSLLQQAKTIPGCPSKFSMLQFNPLFTFTAPCAVLTFPYGSLKLSQVQTYCLWASPRFSVFHDEIVPGWNAVEKRNCEHKIKLLSLLSPQQCCYTAKGSTFGNLITTPSFAAGSLLSRQPTFNPKRYQTNDVIPKQQCCRDSNNCKLFYSLRPINVGIRLQNPNLGKSSETLLTRAYTFNSINYSRNTVCWKKTLKLFYQVSNVDIWYMFVDLQEYKSHQAILLQIIILFERQWLFQKFVGLQPPYKICYFSYFTLKMTVLVNVNIHTRIAPFGREYLNVLW